VTVRLADFSRLGLHPQLTQPSARVEISACLGGAMDQIEIALAIALAMAIGFAGGYALRSMMSARRRRRFQRKRREEELRAVEAGRAQAMKDRETQELIPMFLARF
jgi:hypothetical protein